MNFLLLLGSNDDAQAQLQKALSALSTAYTVTQSGPALWSEERQNQSSDRYLNQGVEIAAELDASHLKNQLRDLELKLGRQRGQPRCAIDIDIISARESNNEAWTVLDAKSLSYSYARQALSSWLNTFNSGKNHDHSNQRQNSSGLIEHAERRC
jgi:2-amino-4-hydroxy-6-hydroxymethyldihydropteridine diphosphokinase